MLYITKFEKDLTKSYTQVSFNWIKSLQTQNVNFEIRPLDNVLDWNLAPKWIAEPSKEYFSECRSDLDCALLHLQPGDLLKTIYKDKNKSIGATTFETSTLPLWIAEGLNENYKGLIVPSYYNKKSLLDSGVKIPIEVVYHSIEDWWDNVHTPIEKDPNIYVFGYIGSYNNRKNPKLLIESYIEAFPESRSDCALMIKTFTSALNMKEIESLVGDRTDIWVYNEMWSQEQLLWGYGLIDCYVSAHRGEGFGLTLAQAAYLGKPVMYTNYSAPIEWLDDTHHYPIKWDHCEVIGMNSEMHQHFNGAHLEWADPKKEDLVKHFKLLADKKPKSGFEGDVLNSFKKSLTWDSIGQDLTSSIESILQFKLKRL